MRRHEQVYKKPVDTYYKIMVFNQIVNYTSSDPLSQIFAALADPTRRAILAHLSTGDASVTELAAPFTMSLPAISKHLKILEEAGLISQTRDAQYRPRHLEAERLAVAMAWLDDYRRFWEGNMDNLDAYLADIQAKR